MADIDSLIADFQNQQAQANAANEKRYQQALHIASQITSLYRPGGGFMGGVEAGLEKSRKDYMASAQQALINAGLGGTTQSAASAQKFEEDVAQPTRLQAKDIATERYAQALSNKAGIIERREDVGPDYATVAQLAMEAANRPQNVEQTTSGVARTQGPTHTEYNLFRDGQQYTSRSYGGLPSFASRNVGEVPRLNSPRNTSIGFETTRRVNKKDTKNSSGESNTQTSGIKVVERPTAANLRPEDYVSAIIERDDGDMVFTGSGENWMTPAQYRKKFGKDPKVRTP